MRSQIPGLNLEKNRLKPEKDRFLVYFKKSYINHASKRRNKINLRKRLKNWKFN
jgi:hypothetical protein